MPTPESTGTVPAPTTPANDLTYTVDRYASLPNPHFAQRFYLEAFQAIATGGFQQIIDGQARDWPIGLKIGKTLLNWINDHFLAYTLSYPGARHEGTKQQLAELAFSRIKENRLFSPDIAAHVIPIVERFVSDRNAGAK